jgi:very-short-patch-repair endonuclease
MTYRFPFRFRARQPAPKVAPAFSPIEEQFWAAYMRSSNPLLRGLTRQHRVGRYRVDFAVPSSKIGIELDGFINHSTTTDIAHDCYRQRHLQAQGWFIIRFGGAEVYVDPDACVREAAMLAGLWRYR